MLDMEYHNYDHEHDLTFHRQFTHTTFKGKSAWGLFLS